MTSAGGLARHVLSGGLAVAGSAITGDTTAWPAAAPPTRFNHALGPRRVVAGASVPRRRIAAMQRVAGVSANDVVTAVIGGALRRWLIERTELPGRSLVAVCPIASRDRRAPRHAQHGNMFGAWLCPLGTDLVDDARRLNLVHRSMTLGKQFVAGRGAAASLIVVSPSIAMTVLPSLLHARPRWRTGYNLPISHVRGPAEARYWNGALVEHVFPVSAVFDGQGLNVTTCSYCTHIDLGFVTGGDDRVDVGRLAALIETSLRGLEVALHLRAGPSSIRNGT